jgi:mono/diheme cytochrome c family protein
MRNRNVFIVSAAIVLVMLVLFSAQAPGRRLSAAQATASEAATEEDYGAACEAMRTVPKATPAAQPTAEGTAQAEEVEIARPSNPGGPGQALKLTGDPKAGEKIYVDNCQKCHGDQGQGNVKNPGSDDGTVPELNPIDETITDVDPMVYACNIDLFVEHGSVPSGPKPEQTMPAWGDEHKLTDQQIADVISYVMSLNGVTQATPAPTAASK